MNEVLIVFGDSAIATILAQTVTDPNVLGQMQTAFQNFVQSGQVWAMVIGLVIGYVVRGMTS